jgi:SAM-dependent methyltransferase
VTPLPITGERTVPGLPRENYWFRRHEAAYRVLLEEIYGDIVLEIGAGEGYGAALLSARAQRLIALDYDRATIAHLARRYVGARLTPVQANLASLPITDRSVDVIVCLQVIEHVWDHPQFVLECRRVLRPGGRVVISTPNRLSFSPDSDGTQHPQNPFHSHEFIAAELSDLLRSCDLSIDSVRGLDAGPALVELDSRYAAAGYRSFVDAQLSCPPTEWGAELADDVSSVSVTDFTISDPVTDECLDLVVSARRPV